MLKRPILIILLGYITGIIIGLYCKISIALFVIALLYIILRTKVQKDKKIKRYCKIFCIKKAIIIFSISALISGTITLKQNYEYENEFSNIGEEEFVAVVVSIPKTKKYYTQYKVKIEKINNDKSYKNTYVYLNLKSTSNIKYGSIISFKGEFIEPEVARNYKGFSYKEYLKSVGIYGTIKADNIKVIGNKNLGVVKTLANSASLKIKETIKEHIEDEDNRNLLLGILIGYDDELSKNIKEDFQNSSLSHILAVSGMHVSFVIMFVVSFLSKLKSPKKTSKLICIVFLIFFIFLTGETPSVKRACIMAILGIISQLVYRKSDTITSLSVSLLIILICNPFSIMDIRLILSFVATCGILFFYKIIFELINNKINKKNNKIITKINEIVSISISAQILIFPLTILFFNKISLTFLLSNLLISIFIGTIIVLGFIVVIIPIDILFKIVEILLEILQKIASIFSSMPISHINVVTPNLNTIVIYYILVFAVTYIFFISKNPVKRKIEKKILTNVDKFKSLVFIYKKILITICIVILILLQIAKLVPNDLRIYFIDVGQGDSCLILTPSNKTILIDGGGSKDSEEFDVGKSTLLPYLLDRKVSKIDYMMISHFDADHMGSFVTVLQNIKVGKLIISKQVKNSNEFMNIIQIVKNKNIEVVVVKAEDKIHIENNVVLEILYPEKELKFSDLNNNSIVAKLVYGGFSMLFTGDIEKEAEGQILKEYKDTNILNSTVLKVAHHGSKTSSTDEFIEFVNPKIALIGVGKNNLFGHPNEDVIKMLEKYNSKIYRTDLNGEITIRVNKKGSIKIDKMLN